MVVGCVRFVFTGCLVVSVVVRGRWVCPFFFQHNVWLLVWWWVGFFGPVFVCMMLGCWWVVDGCVCFLHSVWCWCGGGW